MENNSYFQQQPQQQKPGIVDTAPAPGPGQRQQSLYNFSPEELRVLRECNRESLIFRSIPFATVFSCGAYYAMLKGHVKTSARYGFVPKVTIAAFFGYFIGKLSYQSTCTEKLLQLPDSKLADAIRKAKGISVGQQNRWGGESGLSNPGASEVFTTTPLTPIFDDHKPDERDRNEGLDEYNKVADSLSEYSPVMLESAEPAVSSYEERRQLNRTEYNTRQQPTQEVAPAPPVRARTPTPQLQHKNKYGDIVTDEA